MTTRLLAAAAGGIAWFGLAAILSSAPLVVRYVLAFLLFTAGPGALLTSRLARGLPTLERLVIALAVGTAAAPVLAELLARLGLVTAFPLLATILTAVAVVDLLHDGYVRCARSTTVGLAIVVLLALTTTLFTFGTHRLESRPDRVTVFGDYDSVDLSYYAVITAELSHTVPPEAPFHSGHRLNYSYHPQLLLAMVHRFGDVPILHLYFRYAWPGFLVLTALIALLFVQRISTTGAALLAVSLLLVGGDFSYLAAWVLPHASYEWDYLLWPTNFLAPTMEILHFSTWTPALPVFFGGLYALERFLSTRRPGWAGVAAFCIAMLVASKPFAFAIVLAGLAGAGLLTRDASGRWRLAGVTLASVALATPLLYRILTLYEESRSRLTLDDFLLPRRMLIKLDVERAFDGMASAIGASGFARTAVVLLLATLLFFAGGLGVRWLGLPSVWRALRSGLASASIWSVLGWTVVAGVAVPFVLVTEPYHDTLQFYQVALYLLWIFTAAAVLRPPASRARHTVLIATIVLLALPSSVHYLLEKAGDGPKHPLASLSRSELLIAAYLNRQDAERTVVLHDRPLEPSLLAIASERRVVLAWARGTSYVKGSEARRADVERFFGSANGSAADALETLKRYRVTHVVDRLERDRIHPEVLARLRPVLRASDAVLYEVTDQSR